MREMDHMSNYLGQLTDAFGEDEEDRQDILLEMYTPQYWQEFSRN